MRYLTLALLALPLLIVAPAEASGWSKRRADLFGPGVADAKFVYREKLRSDGLERRFKAKIEGATPRCSR